VKSLPEIIGAFERLGCDVQTLSLSCACVKHPEFILRVHVYSTHAHVEGCSNENLFDGDADWNNVDLELSLPEDFDEESLLKFAKIKLSDSECCDNRYLSQEFEKYDKRSTKLLKIHQSFLLTKSKR
jgi:hypothetical protein